MKVISVLNSKGGCGKSTLATNLATCFANAGNKVLILDADPQNSSYQWRLIRERANIVCVPVTTATQLKQLEGYSDNDIVIIDSGGSDSELFRYTMLSAQQGLLLIPVIASVLDLWGLRHTLNVLTKARELNVPIKALCVMNGIKSKSSLPIQAKEAVGFICEQNDVQLLDTTIGDREAFRQAFQRGLGVIEHEPNSKASAEINELYQQIKEELK